MFKVYTSYFNCKRLERLEDKFTIAICQVIYSGNANSHWSHLAPDQKMRDRWNARSISWEQFELEYISKLEYLKITGVLDSFVGFIHDVLKYYDAYLLCYEYPRQHCHRHTLANFLNKHYGLAITEF